MKAQAFLRGVVFVCALIISIITIILEPMNTFEQRVQDFIKQNNMIASGSTVVVGFSGGADSTALILSLYELRKLLNIRLIAVHINHLIRKEAGEDAQFVKSFCKERNIECIVVEKDIPKLSQEWKMTEEEAGRRARYEAFEEILKEKNASYIAIAHHQNDVAETLLMNLFRGSGVHGAGAIRPVRGNIIRPLLCVARSEIEVYLQDKGQLFCHDATNDEDIHTRNIVRNRLLPLAEKEINSAAVSHLCRAALEFSKADAYISKASTLLYEKCAKESTDSILIDLTAIRDEDEVLKDGVILKALEKLTPSRKDITAAHIDSIKDLANGRNGTASVDLPYNLEAVRSYDELQIKKKNTKNSSLNENEFKIPSFLNVGDEMSFSVPNLGMAHIEILTYNGGKLFPSSAYTKWFDYDRIQGAVFRKRKTGDYILVEQNTALHKKTIAKLMTDEKVPKFERDEIYLLTDGNNVLWVPGIRMSGAFKINENTKKILAINIDNGGFSNG